ncbi:F-box protein SKIP31 isoform X3 [Canna indica]|uniref:F-box protein SKIP31 isoform X3 n=1 Tax=Canna indica TaxID=4628 RepID=A0AAQ3KRP8_9LILI|nr:F-box protein SKIP31 isoform X3 [Canna indica]
MEDPVAAGGDDEYDILASFLESEIPSSALDQLMVRYQEEELTTTSASKRVCNEAEESTARASKRTRVEEESSQRQNWNRAPFALRQIETGIFSKIPPELFHHIFKFLSSEDLIACALVCKFMNFVASDESLWRRLYALRWGIDSSKGKLRACAWKKLYIQRDEEDMIEFVRNTPTEFKEYYIQMQAAKRSQVPVPSQVDDRVLLDKTVADQVSMWKSSRGLTDDAATGHSCSGNTCSYSQIGDVFICEKTGRVHVCDDTCREVVLDHSSGILVCTISGHCFDRLLTPEEESDTLENEQQQSGVVDEAEPFMGSGRFARAYLLGYNCADEKELEAALKFC